MADELEPVTQEFEADLSNYIEPIRDASDETEGFADVVKEAGEALSGLRDEGAEAGEGLADLRDKAGETGEALTGLGAGADDADVSLDAMAGSEDDATVSTDALSESLSSLRDKVYETYPGIDEATASLLAEASAAQAAGIENEEYAGSLGAAQYEAGGLYATLGSIKDILGAAGIGESLSVTATGMNQFLVETEEDAENAGNAITGLQTDASLLDDAMLKAANSTRDFWDAVNALNPALGFSENIAIDANAALRAMGATESEAAAGANALAKAQLALDNLGSGGVGFLGGIASFFGSSGEGEASLGGLLGNEGSLGAGAGIAAAIAAAAVGITGFVSGLGASLIGIGSLVALAIPGFEKITGAIKDTRKELGKLPADERGAVEGIKDIEDEYKSMAKAFEPDVFRLVDQGLKVAKDILPGLKEPADVTAGVISGLLGQLDKLLSPKYADVITGTGQYEQMKRVMTSDPMKQFDSVIDPYIKTALPAFAHGLGELGGAFEKLFTTMSPKDVKDDIRDFFGVVSFSLGKVSELVEHTMNAWDDLHRGFVNSRQWLTDVGNWITSFEVSAGTKISDFVHGAERDFDAFAKSGEIAFDEAIAIGERFGANLNNWTDDVSRDLDDARHDVAAWGDDTISWFTRVGHDIEAVWDAVPGWFERVGRDLVQGLINGIESMLGPLRSIVDTAANWAKDAWDFATGSHSPSQQMHIRGVGFVDGLIGGIQSREGSLRAEVERLGLGSLAMGSAAFPSAAGSGGSSAPSVHVTVPITLTPGTQGYDNPAFLQYLQREVQEATLRYGQLNPGNGLARIVPGIRT